MKSLKKTAFYFLFLLAISIQAQKVSKSELIDDLKYLKENLEKTHIDLYAFVAKNEFESNFNKVLKEINKDVYTLKEATTYFQRVVTKVNNAHTNISFPVNSYINFIKSGGKIFPFELIVENEKVRIKKNWSTNKEIKEGAYLLSINNIPIEKIINKIYTTIRAESIYFKNAQLESFSFPRYFWQSFGEIDNFKIQITTNKRVQTFVVDAIKAIEDYENIREDVINYKRQLRFFDRVAYLNPANFGGSLEEYKKFIDSSFVEINKRSKNLIIDLRNNSGGDDVFSDYLVSFIANKPFRWNSKYHVKTSNLLKEHLKKKNKNAEMSSFTKAMLSRKDGEVFEYDFGYYQPQKPDKRFNGKVYVLVNRHSYSQATVTAAQFQDYKLATIVGEETAEHPNLYASIFQFHLPNTKVEVNVSKGKITRVSGDLNKRGVLPEIEIKDDIFTKNDEVLESLLIKLKNK